MVIDLIDGGFPQRLAAGLRHRHAVHRDEPLRRGEEDHRVVTAPAVRILMREGLAMPQASALGERRFDFRVGVEDALAAEQFDGIQEVSRRTDRGVDFQSVAHAGVEVVGAVSGRRVNRARAGVQRDVGAEHAHRIALVERMPETDAFKLVALHLRDRRSEIAPDCRAHSRREILRDDDRASVYVVGRVVELRMKRDPEIRRNRPGRRRPDQH